MVGVCPRRYGVTKSEVGCFVWWWAAFAVAGCPNYSVSLFASWWAGVDVVGRHNPGGGHFALFRIGQWWGRERRNGENGTTNFIVVRFRDAPCGPPTSWVSPAIPPSHIHPSSEIELAHIPQKRGGAHTAGFCGVERGGTARLTVWVDEVVEDEPITNR